MFRFTFACCFVLFSFYTQAAVYKCVDKNGVASFSQRPCPAKKAEGDTEAHKLLKELRMLSNQGNEVVNSVGADLDSIRSCQAQAKQYHAQWQSFAQRIDGLPKDHKAMKQAYASLEECGICSARGNRRCDTARQQLNEAQNLLVKSVDQNNPKGWASR